MNYTDTELMIEHGLFIKNGKRWRLHGFLKLEIVSAASMGGKIFMLLQNN